MTEAATDTPAGGFSTDTVIEPEVLANALSSIEIPILEEEAPVRQRVGCVGKKADVAAVIVAGGSGERFGRSGGKQLISVFDQPLLTWCLQTFDAVSQVGRIIIACPEDRIDEYRAVAVEPFDLVTPVDFVPSGTLRQESAMHGVNAVPEEFKFIAMHDGARPLVQPETVEHALNVLKGTLDADGVVCGHPAIDTIKVIDGETVIGTPDRSLFWIAQTPQIFHADVLRSAHQAAMEEGFVGTDDSSLVERVGGHVVLVDCSRNNIKLTVPEDLPAVQAFLRQRYAAYDRQG